MPFRAVALLFVFSLSDFGNAADAQPPGLLLANVYRNDVDVGDYWISEKLDGVRAYWNGRRLVSRNGRVFQAPDWFTEGFPDVPLDGELWMGRGTFEELSGAVRREMPDESQWRRIRFMVFDLPADTGAFDQRLERLRKLLSKPASSHIAVIEQFKVSDHDDLMARMEALVKQGGEGLMLHRGSSLYQAARSDDLLKLKPYYDAEAVVLAHVPGRGKYEGMLGALLVETPDGIRFRIGSGFSDQLRRNPPPPGAVITYKYFGKTNNGVPRFASYLRTRARF